MKITPITIFFFLCSMAAVFNIITRFRRNLTGLRSAVTWIIVWLLISLGAIFPWMVDGISRIGMMKDRMLFILVVANFVLFALLFNLTFRVERLQRNLTRTIQDLALANIQIDSSSEG